MEKFLEITGIQTQNLKNISLKIPKNKITVITGISGSGKTSLAFKTIYAIGQQKYFESLSHYARMFIGGIQEEPIYESVSGISPTICIDQKTLYKNPRSTVGTITGIYDYYRLLYLHIGKRRCTQCGSSIEKHSIEDIMKEIHTYQEDALVFIKAPYFLEKRTQESIVSELLHKGYIRFSLGPYIYTIQESIAKEHLSLPLSIIIDRFSIKNIKDSEARIKESIEHAFEIGKGNIELTFFTERESITKKYSNTGNCQECGYSPPPLSYGSFSFNSHIGMCEACKGIGEVPVFLEKNIVNEALTLEEGAILPWMGNTYYEYLLTQVCKAYTIPMNIPYKNLTTTQKNILLYGDGMHAYSIPGNYNISGKKQTVFYKGVIPLLEEKYMHGGVGSFEEKDRFSQYITYLPCKECNGYRLNKESLSVEIQGMHIGKLCELSIKETKTFFQNLSLSQKEKEIAKNIIKNIQERIDFLSGVGVEYLTLSRKAETLSGGETQRIRLATQISSRLEGVTYVLDEPSIGLHPKDHEKLIHHIQLLKDLGNTLIIVEHDEDMMRHADYIIDLGPGAGTQGGYIVDHGKYGEIVERKRGATGIYLSGQVPLCIPHRVRKEKTMLSIYGASENNLKHMDVHIPLHHFVVVTGVSGSGKSTLIHDILGNFLHNTFSHTHFPVGKHKAITGWEHIDRYILMDQSPIGRKPSSIPATYTGVFTHIRELFAQTKESKMRGYKAGHFSFNTKLGRCPSCEGEGVKKIEMGFLPPVYVPCESCEGKRYRKEVLQILFKGKNIAQVLEMTIDEAVTFFENHSTIVHMLTYLQKVGLGYLRLGQSSLTLSGGEAQRIKLATELVKTPKKHTLYILDEPTTGLHFADIEKLLSLLHALVDKGHSVIVIEHNLQVILNADYIIDLGPYGGEEGGNVVFAGTLEKLYHESNTLTAQALKEYIARKDPKSIACMYHPKL